MKQISRIARKIIPLTAFAVAAAIAGVGAPAMAATHDRDGAAENRARGLVHAGLVRADKGPCAGGWRLDAPGLGNVCTHGPDPAPPGVDVTRYDVTPASLTAESATASSVPVLGDGTSGKRVQIVYAVASDQVDRYAESLALITGIAGRMNDAVVASAAATGGTRYLRFVTNADGSLNVAHVVLSPTGDDNFTNTVTELRAKGFNSTSRKYVILADAQVYCGIGQLMGDDRPGLDNPATASGGYGRIDRACWDRSDHLSELHELMHTMGSVQPSAPHASAVGHCTDENDAMCYQDAAEVVMTYPCAVSSEWLLDCGHDDYFSTDPPAGSYLATHWNVASSEYLATSLADGGGSTPDPPPVDPTPVMVTDTFSGSVSAKRPTKSFNISVGAGQANSELAFTAGGRAKTIPQMTLRVIAADGSVAASGTGPSVLRNAVLLAKSTYRVEVSSSSSVSFALTVTHPAA